MAPRIIGTDGNTAERRLARRDRGAARPDFAPLQELRGYWDGLRQGARLPERSEIDPRGFAGALQNAFLIERISPGLARFRLCGMHLHDVMGMDATGMPLSVLFEPAARERLGKALQQVFDGPSVLELTLEAVRGAGRPPLSGGLVILPLRDRAGGMTMALGGLATGGEIGDRPRQFAIATLMTEALARPPPALKARAVSVWGPAEDGCQ